MQTHMNGWLSMGSVVTRVVAEEIDLGLFFCLGWGEIRMCQEAGAAISSDQSKAHSLQ